LKVFSFHLDDYAVGLFFKPVRRKRELLGLLINATKYMLVSPTINPANVVGEMRLYVDKMSRIFFFSDNKYVSFNFPFKVSDENGQVRFYSDYLESLDNKATSELLTIIQSDGLNEASCILDFYSEFVDIVEYREELWGQFLDLLRFEDGYIRFDHDPASVNGDLHPLNHLDVFYSGASTFKLGSNARLSRDEMVDLLNIRSDCAFLQ
jgi:hypothetical protein